MSVVMSRNLVVGPAGAPYFMIGSNLVPCFEIGSPKGSGPWLRGEFAKNSPEPVFNGRLYLPGFSEPGVIIDTFPKGPTPEGWFQRRQIDIPGYELRRKGDEMLILSFEFLNGICRITTDIMDKKGKVVARASADSLEVMTGSFRIPGCISIG